MNKKVKHGLIAGAAVLAVVGAALYLNNNKKNKPAPKPNPNNGGGGGNNPNPNNGGDITPELDFRTLADNLFYAFDGYGTDNVTAINTFNNLKSDDDFDKLVAAYGTRTVSSGMGNIFHPDFTGDLAGAINSEMNATQIGYINTILSTNGITRKF